MKCFFYIRNSKITNRQVLAKLFEELKDGKYSCEVVSETKRSNSQNSWFHAILPIVLAGLQDAGYKEVKDVKDAKLVVKTLFLKKKIENVETGEIIEVIRDTHDLNTADFTIFMKDIQEWGSSYLNVYIPDPNEAIKFNY